MTIIVVCSIICCLRWKKKYWRSSSRSREVALGELGDFDDEDDFDLSGVDHQAIDVESNEERGT